MFRIKSNFSENRMPEIEVEDVYCADSLSSDSLLENIKGEPLSTG